MDEACIINPFAAKSFGFARLINLPVALGNSGTWRELCGGAGDADEAGRCARKSVKIQACDAFPAAHSHGFSTMLPALGARENAVAVVPGAYATGLYDLAPLRGL